MIIHLIPRFVLKILISTSGLGQAKLQDGIINTTGNMLDRIIAYGAFLEKTASMP
jgi:hypothetical protein